jgi:hypothetical protein
MPLAARQRVTFSCSAKKNVTKKKAAPEPPTEEIVYEADKKKFNLLRVYVSLGSRAVSSEVQKKTPTVFYSVEATFRVDYLVKGELSKAEVREFTEFNSAHNVWPFWRQHVFTTAKVAELPHIDVPLMRGIASSRKKLSTKKIAR